MHNLGLQRTGQEPVVFLRWVRKHLAERGGHRGAGTKAERPVVVLDGRRDGQQPTGRDRLRLSGNQQQLSISYGGTNAAYDAEGRLAQVTLGVVVATYDYDAEGRRVKRTDANGVATYYVYDADGQLMAEYGGAATGSGTQYLATDHLGSTRLVQDAQGNCAMRMDYAPYGVVVPRNGQDCYGTPWTSEMMFTGALRDGDTTAGTQTGLDHMGAREYWASLGRFISPDPENAGADPASPGNWNMYSYAYNNPLMYTDPTGLAGLCGTDPQSETGADKTGCLAEFLYENVRRQLWDQMTRATQKVVEFASKPRDPGCVGRAAGVGAAAGGIVGGTLGAAGGGAAGAAGGTLIAPGVGTLGGGFAGGAAGLTQGTAYGALAGGALGGAVGWLACSSGTGQGGSSGDGRRASGSEARLTKPQQRQTAKYLGMKEVKGLTSQGQLVFEKGGRYFSFSNTSHTDGEVFKELDRSGTRIATTDLNLNRIGR